MRSTVSPPHPDVPDDLDGEARPAGSLSDAAADGKLEEMEPPEWDSRACVGVVGASAGYPGAYEKGHPINGLEEAEADDDTVVFHAGTRSDDGQVLTAGGRVLSVTSLAANVEAARDSAYSAFDKISWTGKFCRRDIGLPRAAHLSAEEEEEEDDRIQSATTTA